MNTYATIQKLPTGVKRLDTVLKGGLVRNDIHLVYGSPGTGKTILCHQICFHLIRSLNFRCIYLNLLTESPHEIITHMQPFSFYDTKAIPDSLFYLMAEGHIKSNGVMSLVELIGETIQRRNAQLFIFEGIENALFQAPSQIDFIDLISKIRALTRIHSCTILLTIKQQQPNPALTIVDSILELSDTITGLRSVKQLTVHKTRGSGFLSGKHEVELTSDGLEIHPRTESIPVTSPRVYDRPRKRMALGVKELDTMMDGGILSGSNLAIMGMPGAGKTTLGLSFLVEGAKTGQEGIYLGYSETPSQLMEKTDGLDMPLRYYVERDMIHMMWQSPQELILDSTAERLIEFLNERGNGEIRIFIDGIEGFNLAAVYSERLPLFFSALLGHLHNLNATSVISKNISLFTPVERTEETNFTEQMSESTILLRYLRNGAHMCRFLSIIKMRESWYQPNTKSFYISKGGFNICDIDEKTRDVMRRLRIHF